MRPGKVVFLAAVTVIGGNFIASKSSAFRGLWSR